MLTLMEMYVEGISTRKVREITETLCGTRFAKSLVSELARQLDTELDAWRNRPLTATTYPSLSVDAHYEHVRHGGHAAQRVPGSQRVLIVAGVRGTGTGRSARLPSPIPRAKRRTTCVSEISRHAGEWSDRKTPGTSPRVVVASPCR